jgi:hypothetical protein
MGEETEWLYIEVGGDQLPLRDLTDLRAARAKLRAVKQTQAPIWFRQKNTGEWLKLGPGGGRVQR